ncbi:hypothetical protein KBB06_02145 [Candidatus Gracilibacteria bacterium]|nr:hypothetical protein [Candidatus Gracilibacteria bacterium]
MDYQPEYKPQYHSSEGEEIIEMYLDDHQGIKYQRSPSAHRANYKMFHYNDMDKIPFFTIFK